MFYGQIEGTGFECITPEFNAAFIGHARVERLWSGARWLEGPAYFPAHARLVFSDIPNNRMLSYCEQSGHVSPFRSPSNNANGNTLDKTGRLISCEHLTRRVTRTEHDGTITVLASHYNGKRLNSPNDVVVKSDGSIWFTDPDYGIKTDYEGDKQTREQALCCVYRIDPETLDITCVTDALEKPNGLAFSKDEQTLYIADSGRDASLPYAKSIVEFKVSQNTLHSPHLFTTCTSGIFDGIRADQQGRLWAAAHDGVHCFNHTGILMGKIKIPEIVSNICFGGVKRNRLYICGTTSLYACYLVANGL